MAKTKISQLSTWTGNTTGFYVVVDNSGLTQTYKTTRENLIGDWIDAGTINGVGWSATTTAPTVATIINENNIGKIYIFDKKQFALKRISDFFSNYKNSNKLIFVNNQKKIKKISFFLAFLCTYAFNRIRLIKKIKSLCNIKYFIVEKILETNISNFKKISFNTKNIFVNMPLRNISPFRIIKLNLNSKKLMSY